MNLPQLRKSKSSMFQSLLRPKRSKVGLHAEDTEHPSLRAPPVPDYAAYLPSSAPRRAPSPQIVSPSPKQDFKRKRRKRDFSDVDPPPSLPSKDDELRLDTNLEDLRGIVDPSALHRNGSPTSPTSSGHFPQTYSTHSRSHSSDHSMSSRNGNPPDFRNPFIQPPSYPSRGSSINASKQLANAFMDSKVSPKTITSHPIQLPGRPIETPDDPNIPSWVPPESWAVQPESEEPNEEYSSGGEDGSVTAAQVSPPRLSSSVASITSSTDSLRHNIDAVLPHSLNPHRNRNRMVKKPSIASTIPRPLSYSSETATNNWKIRIYLANHKYHIISVSFGVTVAALMPKLNQKILKGAERETHRLYLQERRRGECTPFSQLCSN